jgi:hypothetical protein
MGCPQIGGMNNRRESMQRISRALKPAPRVPAARNLKVARLAAPAVVRRRRSRDLQRGLIATASLVALLGCVLAGGYGVHSQMAAASERAALQYAQLAAATSAELRNGAILFVPIGGSVCRRRWIDNATWTLRDGGEVECERAAAWNATLPELQPYHVGQRMDAVRSTFRSRSAGNLE